MKALAIRRYEAAERYWSAKSRSEDQAAYYEMLLKGCRNGYPSVGRLRSWIAQKLRTMAAVIDEFD